MSFTNAQVLAGAGTSDSARLYRELVASTDGGHNALCDAYGLDRDNVRGGTHWTDIVWAAVTAGDIDLETRALT